MSKRIAVYGGVFDPITKGHLHIIEKAANMFEEVIIVKANNPNKKAVFSEMDRWDMLRNATQNFTNVRSKILPINMYLVNYAKELNAQYLIRGIRDTIDFPYELNIYRTNRLITKEVETIYLMPDDAYSLVSSSWIKSLIGLDGWEAIIAPHVTEYVMMKLKMKLEGMVKEW